MKKVYKIEVDCAVCANKVESAISKMKGVSSCVVNYITQKMILEMDAEISKDELLKVARKVEPDFEIND